MKVPFWDSELQLWGQDDRRKSLNLRGMGWSHSPPLLFLTKPSCAWQGWWVTCCSQKFFALQVSLWRYPLAQNVLLSKMAQLSPVNNMMKLNLVDRVLFCLNLVEPRGSSTNNTPVFTNSKTPNSYRNSKLCTIMPSVSAALCTQPQSPDPIMAY